MRLFLLTEELGLVKARVQGLRHPGAKLASALQTLTEANVMLVRGREGWRLSGATLVTNHFQKLPRAARERAARVSGLLTRLVHGESPDASLFRAFSGFLAALSTFPEREHTALECVAALRILGILGLDEGGFPGSGVYDNPSVLHALENRSVLVERINRGIEASGL